MDNTGKTPFRLADKAVKKPVKYLIYSEEQAFRHMTRKRTDKEQLLYMITDDVMFNVWDAMYLSLDLDQREIYLPFLPHVFDLLRETYDGTDLCDYLVFIEENRFGAQKGDTLSGRRAMRVVELLLEYRDTIYGETVERPGKQEQREKGNGDDFFEIRARGSYLRAPDSPDTGSTTPLTHIQPIGQVYSSK